jgi:hypothetical protein
MAASAVRLTVTLEPVIGRVESSIVVIVFLVTSVLTGAGRPVDLDVRSRR